MLPMRYNCQNRYMGYQCHMRGITGRERTKIVRRNVHLFVIGILLLLYRLCWDQCLMSLVFISFWNVVPRLSSGLDVWYIFLLSMDCRPLLGSLYLHFSIVISTTLWHGNSPVLIRCWIKVHVRFWSWLKRHYSSLDDWDHALSLLTKHNIFPLVYTFSVILHNTPYIGIASIITHQ